MVGLNGYFVNPKRARGSSWPRRCGEHDRCHLHHCMALAKREARYLPRYGETDPTGWGI